MRLLLDPTKQPNNKTAAQPNTYCDYDRLNYERKQHRFSVSIILSS